MNEFNDISGSIDGIKFTIRKVMLALDELKQELAKKEARMEMFGDAHANIEKDIEYLNSQTEDITQNMGGRP